MGGGMGGRPVVGSGSMVPGGRRPGRGGGGMPGGQEGR